MWRDAGLVAGKDLRIEARSRVATNQVAPFAVMVLVLFAFAIDPDRGVLSKAAPGLFWVAVLFSALLAVQRSFSIEAADSARDGLRLSGLDPAGIFLGKAAAIALELMAGNEHRGSGAGGVLDDGVHEVATALVEAGMGLVEEPQLGVAGHDHGDRGPAPLAGRQAADRHVGQAPVEAETGHRRVGVGHGPAAGPGPEADVVGHRQLVVQRRGVTQQPDPTAHGAPVAA